MKSSLQPQDVDKPGYAHIVKLLYYRGSNTELGARLYTEIAESWTSPPLHNIWKTDRRMLPVTDG